MSKYLSYLLKDTEPYTPGEQPKVTNLIKLNTNESPFPPSPKVVEAISAEAVGSLNLYSDPTCSRLVSAIARRLGVSENQIVPSNGSDEILSFCFRAFCDDKNQPVFADITYGFYPVFCGFYALKPTIVPLRGDLSLCPSDYEGLNRPIFIANPNAPTGLCISLDDVARICASNDSVVVIDEAYVDFGGDSAIALLDRFDNLIVVRTFSKSRNLAGARLGFAVTSPELADDLNRVKYSFNPYNVNTLSCIAGEKAMEDDDYFKSCVGSVIKTREYTVRELEKRGFSIPDSKANFIFPEHEKLSGETYFTELRKRNILVRHFGSERIRNRVRITIGSPEQMKALIAATDDILESAL